MHYGTFDLTDEPLDEPPRRFHAEATRRALEPVAAWTLDVGETRAWCLGEAFPRGVSRSSRQP